MTMLKTLHGSRLYNLHHENSDYDYYTVVLGPLRKTKHKIAGDQDNLTIDMRTFLVSLNKGVPQALEALYSPIAEIDELQWLREAYRPMNYQSVYIRTIRNFREQGTTKMLRHARRLEFGLDDLERYGRLFPRMSGARREELLSIHE